MFKEEIRGKTNFLFSVTLMSTLHHTSPIHRRPLRQPSTIGSLGLAPFQPLIHKPPQSHPVLVLSVCLPFSPSGSSLIPRLLTRFEANVFVPLNLYVLHRAAPFTHTRAVPNTITLVPPLNPPSPQAYNSPPHPSSVPPRTHDSLLSIIKDCFPLSASL